MNNYKSALTAAAMFLTASGTASAVVVDFKSLADGALGESGWSTLMFQADGSHTTIAANSFLNITGTTPSGSAIAYLDSGNAGLGVCGSLTDAGNIDTAFANSTTNLCNPSSDDNITAVGNSGELAHFVFGSDVVIDNIWVNNNHDGDRSLLNDTIAVGIDGATASTFIDNGGSGLDSLLALNLFLSAGSSLDVGFDPICGNTSGVNNCELYISKIEFHQATQVAEPAVLSLLGLGLLGFGAARLRK